MGVSITNSDLGPSDLFTMQEAAEYLGITVESVRNLVYVNKIQPVNRNGETLTKNWLFSESSLIKRKNTVEQNKTGFGNNSPWRSGARRRYNNG